MNKIELLITRDDVSAGDIEGLEITYTLEYSDVHSENQNLCDDLVGFLKQQNFFPTIAGEHATWVLVALRPICMVLQQSGKVFPFNFSSDTLINETQYTNNTIHAVYMAQANPHEAFATLQRYKTAAEVLPRK